MRNWVRRSFKNRVFVMVALVTLVPLLLCDVVMMRIQIDRSERGRVNQAQLELAGLEARLEETCLRFGEMAEGLCRSTIVHSALRRGGGDSRTLYQLLFRTAAPCREYARLDIYDREGRRQYTTGGSPSSGTLEKDWGVLRAADGAEGLVFCPGEGDDALVGARAVRNSAGVPLGYVTVAVTRTGFDRLFSGAYSAPNDVALLDPFWRPVYCSQNGQSAAVEALRAQLLAGEPLTGEGGEFYFFAARSGTSGLTLLLQQPKTFTSQVMRTIYTVSVLMGALCLGLCLWCAWALSRYLTRPVRALDEAMGEVERGNLSVRVPDGREDELGRLADSFNRMVREYRANLERSVQRQRELNETQRRMLQAQLNPHFLYNTLDSIKWLGVTHHVPQVAALATDLAALLRASISENELITLEQDLELTDRYIDIQLLRFEDRFTCEIDVPERLRRCLVPKLVLQPLVENAIIHGLAGREDGYIKLWAEEEGEDLLLFVSDNGCGIPAEVLERLNGEERRGPGGHLGLYNVDSIVRLHFGPGYGLSARSRPGEGSTVCLRLPMRKEDEDHAEGPGG